LSNFFHIEHHPFKYILTLNFVMYSNEVLSSARFFHFTQTLSQEWRKVYSANPTKEIQKAQQKG